jgi:hypothetical protein
MPHIREQSRFELLAAPCESPRSHSSEEDPPLPTRPGQGAPQSARCMPYMLGEFGVVGREAEDFASSCWQPRANHSDRTLPKKIPRCQRAPVKELRDRRDARPNSQE